MATNGAQGGSQPEYRGNLFNEHSKREEYFVLRGGVLRARGSDQEQAAMYIAAAKTSVALLANNRLQIRCRVPHEQELTLAAKSEAEAEGWHDMLQASMKAGEERMSSLLDLLSHGCTLHKYNYSNSKRSRRFFWVEDGELKWGRAKGDDVESQKVNLRECIGIIYGPMTTTFQRCESREDPDWACFSLLFMGRTLDLAVVGDLQVHAWFLGLQHLISLHGVGSMPIMSEAQFYLRKVQFKLTQAAHRQGYVLGRFLVTRIKEAASKPKQKGLGAGALVSGGPLAKPMQHFANEKAASKTSKGGSSELRLKVVQLQAQVRAKLCEAELSTEIKNQQAAGALPSASEELQKVLQKMALEVVEKRCKELEAQASSLTKANEKLAPQAKTADKSERSLRKLQAKFEECETRRRSLEKELGLASGSATGTAPSAGKSAGNSAGNSGRSQELHLTIAELEKKLKNGQGGVAEQAATENKRHDEALAKAEQEKLHLAQRLEALEQEHQSTLEAEKQIQAKLARTQQASRSLDQQVAPFKAAVAQLREEQRKMRAEVAEVGSVFDGEIQKLLSATAGMAERTKALEHKYKMAMEDRKKLHNMVLDLKGNIRVFVRVRPINSKEKPNEPEGEATIGFKEDVNIGVFDGQHGRRKWFEFDQVFAPSCAQVQVFEEAKPLATSTLDGYNVCVFAYGQTGSGKTHTMTGTADDPGLNTRVLRELFRIRDERKNEYDIQISISITEIYNEAIRDLLNPSGKDKLDVRINQDGTCGVPGLTETAVLNVDDVLQCIGDAQKNRATSTTDMNEQSSRSHSIVTVRTKCTLRGSDTYVGKIHLIDLAGSENTNKSGVTGQGMKEAQNINKSLSALGDVIQSLVAKSSHTPYRNSKLTMMLKDSLGGDSKTLMIVCTSPAQSNVTETLSSLNFASRARNVELGKAKRNVQSG